MNGYSPNSHDLIFEGYLNSGWTFTLSFCIHLSLEHHFHNWSARCCPERPMCGALKLSHASDTMFTNFFPAIHDIRSNIQMISYHPETNPQVHHCFFPCVEVVINFDFPRGPQTYLHRTGRFSRLGRPWSSEIIYFLKRWVCHFLI